MNYQKIYDDICERGQERILPKEIYTEKHHIIPKCLGGSNEKSNLTILTAREHFLVHYILTRIYPNNSKIWNACFKMCSGDKKQKRFIPDSKLYQVIKTEWCKLNRGENHHAFGKPSRFRGIPRPIEVIEKIRNSSPHRPQTDEFKQWLSENRTGSLNPFFGQTHTQKTLDLLSRLQSGENNGMFGKTHTPEARQCIREARTGTRASPESRKKMSDRMQSNKFSKKSPCIINDVLFDSIRAASTSLNVKEGTIAWRCNSLTKKWIYWNFIK